MKTNLFLTIWEAKSKTKGLESGEDLLFHLAVDSRRSARSGGQRLEAKPRTFGTGVNLALVVPRISPPVAFRLTFQHKDLRGHGQIVAP